MVTDLVRNVEPDLGTSSKKESSSASLICVRRSSAAFEFCAGAAAEDFRSGSDAIDDAKDASLSFFTDFFAS